MASALEDLHREIDECRICGEFATPLTKPTQGMYRGEGRDIFIIGQAPGKTETRSARAFSGQSGKRLDEWLIECGRPANEPRRGVYLTSILKCPPPGDSHALFKRMAHNCRQFLDRQLEIIRPRLVITLGSRSFEMFNLGIEGYDSSIGKLLKLDTEPLLLAQPFKALIHLPHPSGLNLWLNSKVNRERLQRAFASVRLFMEEPA